MLNFKRTKNIIQSWLENYLSVSDGAKNNLALKKRFLTAVTPGMFTVGFIGIILWLCGLPMYAKAMWLYSGFESLVVAFFLLFRKNVILFSVVNNYFFVLFSFTVVLYFGGILHSGGVVFVGLAGALQATFFFKPKQLRLIFIIYLLTVILEAILQPYLTPVPELTPRANLILFVLHILVIASAIYSIQSYYIKQSIDIKEADAKRLKELDSLKTNFYTNITHEFRTPLTVILGLTNPSSKINLTQLKKSIPLIRRNGIRLLHLVNQMLDLSRLEAKEMQLNLVQNDILPFLHQISESFQHLAKEKNIRFHFQTDLKELSMDFDPEKLESIITNLLSNAIKYSNSGSEIKFSISLVSSINEHDFYGYSPFSKRQINSNQILKVEINDNGIGIRKEDIPRIFNRFYQAADNKLHHRGGTGIGLLLVKELVNLLDGQVYIDSEPEEGTQVIIFLPITQNAGNKQYSMETPDKIPETLWEKETSLENSGGTEKPNLLIIEDNDDVVSYLQTITEKYYKIDRAINGKIGIEMALKLLPDIIISDIMMPEKDGYEVCHTLKNDFYTSHIPIILLTAKADKESQISGFEKGADAYIPKPFDPKELLIRLQKLIESREKLKSKYQTLALIPQNIEIDTKNPDEIFLSRLQDIMKENYTDDNFDTIQLTNIIGMSRVQFFRKLKALTGLSASHFMRLYRLSIAKEKIEKTKLNISEIAYEVGFKDPAYFTRIFSQEFGISPIQLRQKITH